MDKSVDQIQRDSPVSLLWRRAPWWRAALAAACVTSAATFVGWSADHNTAARAGATPTTPAPATVSPVQPISRDEVITPPSTPPAHPEQTLQLASAPLSQTAPLSGTSDSEEQILATCHPHLSSAPPAVPQISTPSGDAGAYNHMKVHFWINGAGIVTKDVVAAATFGTAEEQAAELEYVRALTFAVPNTKECQVRQIELFGDFIERPNGSGGWKTLANLYPRYSFANDGTLLSRD